ncbi:MAG: VTT domain-containing protein [Methyloceanibacter sp.]|jgi:uncharacterized membrane protein YdjX (TVP38/TMEM64 family)
MTTAPDKPSTQPSWLKRGWPLLLLLAAMALVFGMGWHRYLSLQELALRREALRAAIADHRLLALLVFMGIYAGTVAMSLPGAVVLTVAGGFLFGWLLGGSAAIIAATAGAAAIFLIARSALGEALAARAGPWIERLRQGFQENAFNYLLFLRLVPIFPFWLVNLAPALLGVGFGTYLLATLIGIVPGTFAFAIAGEGLDSVIAAQQAAHQSCLAKMGPDAEKSCPFVLEPSALLTPGLIAGFVALGVVALIPIAVKRFRRKAA